MQGTELHSSGNKFGTWNMLIVDIFTILLNIVDVEKCKLK